MPKKINWEPIRKAYLEEGETYASLALRFGVGKSTIEEKASKEGWSALKKSRGNSQTPEPQKTIKPAPVRRPSPQPQDFDEIEILTTAIASLSAILSGGIEDTRGIGGIATGLCRLIELRNKLQPKSAADLADMAISLGIKPQDFIRALSDKWEKQA